MLESATLAKIKSIDRDDYAINESVGHYRPLAEFINQRGIKRFVEIGCAYANLAKYLLEHTQLEKLISIDPYKAYHQMPWLSTQEHYDTLHDFVIEKMVKHIGRWRLIVDTSDGALDELNLFCNSQSFDMVFIDGDHTYEAVKNDIANYVGVLKPGGILSGHDLTVFPGVDNAVLEYSKSTGKKIQTMPGNVWYFEW